MPDPLPLTLSYPLLRFARKESAREGNAFRRSEEERELGFNSLQSPEWVRPCRVFIQLPGHLAASPPPARWFAFPRSALPDPMPITAESAPLY